MTVYTLINICHSKVCEKIRKVEYNLIMKESFSREKGLMVQFLNKMMSIHVTAGNLMKFDTGIILPYIGSV